MGTPEGVTCGEWFRALLWALGGLIALGVVYLSVRFLHWSWVTPISDLGR